MSNDITLISLLKVTKEVFYTLKLKKLLLSPILSNYPRIKDLLIIGIIYNLRVNCNCGSILLNSKLSKFLGNALKIFGVLK
jgi:hypothetical protein